MAPEGSEAAVGCGKPGGPEPADFGFGFLEAGLEFADLFAHAEDDVDAREIDAKFFDEPLRLPDALDIAVGVHADVSRGTARLDEARTFVVAERLLMHPHEAGCDGDDVARFVIGNVFIPVGVSIRGQGTSPPSWGRALVALRCDVS